MLDGFVLLEAARVEDPEEADKVVLEGCAISAVVPEDLAFFTRLTHLDLGDNRVPFDSLAYLPGLQELHLDCNGLTQLNCPAGGFPKLEVLNLSYNGIDAQSLLALMSIPSLRELDISNNELTSLPAELSGFKSLERLNCDHNRLSSESAFLSLSTLPQLRALSLAHNRVVQLPISATETGFPQLVSFSLAHNLIAHEDSLLPVLHISTLRSLLLYGNPFLSHGKTSKELAEVMEVQRGVQLVTLPPPPPEPPRKLDPRSLAVVPEPPTRRRVAMSMPRSSKAKARPPAPEPAMDTPALVTTEERVPEEGDAGSSFFLTAAPAAEASAGAVGAGGVAAADGEEDDGAVWDALAEELSSARVPDIEMRTAVSALKQALERPDADPVPASTSYLKGTTAQHYRSRVKHVHASRPKPLLRPTDEGGSPAARSAIDGMSETINKLQARLGELDATSAGGGAATDAAYMGSLVATLSAMKEMGVGGNVAAAPLA